MKKQILLITLLTTSIIQTTWCSQETQPGYWQRFKTWTSNIQNELISRIFFGMTFTEFNQAKADSIIASNLAVMIKNDLYTSQKYPTLQSKIDALNAMQNECLATKDKCTNAQLQAIKIVLNDLLTGNTSLLFVGKSRPMNIKVKTKNK